MRYEQTSIPMPVIGTQLTLRMDKAGWWVLTVTVLRQDQGWQPAGRWSFSSRGQAELAAWDALGSAWETPPLD